MKTKEIIYEKVPKPNKITTEQKPSPEYQKGLTGQKPPADYHEGLTGQKPPLERAQIIVIQDSEAPKPTHLIDSKSSESPSFLGVLGADTVQTPKRFKSTRLGTEGNSSELSASTGIKSIGFLAKLGRLTSVGFTSIKKLLFRLLGSKSSTE